MLTKLHLLLQCISSVTKACQTWHWAWHQLPMEFLIEFMVFVLIILVTSNTLYKAAEKQTFDRFTPLAVWALCIKNHTHLSGALTLWIEHLQRTHTFTKHNYLTCINNNIWNTKNRCSITSIPLFAERWERASACDQCMGTRLFIQWRQLVVMEMSHVSSLFTSSILTNYSFLGFSPCKISLFCCTIPSESSDKWCRVPSHRTFSTTPVPHDRPSLCRLHQSHQQSQSLVGTVQLTWHGCGTSCGLPPGVRWLSGGSQHEGHALGTGAHTGPVMPGR